MKKLILWTQTAVLLLALSVDSYAQQPAQVKSDYQIQQNFKDTYKDIAGALETITRPAEADSLITRVKQLESNYAQHEELLNKVFYPETFDQRMRELKKRTVTVRDRLTTIQRQDMMLSERNEELSKYTEKLARLNSLNDSLKIAISKSEKSEKQLSSMVRRYRENLEQRDELILSIVDSVMVAYENLDIESLQDLENAQKKARFDSEGNALNMIRNIISENIAFLESNPDLRAVEYLRMNEVQHKFSDMWQRVGKELVQIYGDDNNPQEVREEVNQTIGKWGSKVDTLTWNSIANSFNREGINLPQFNDSESFYSSLDTYLAGALESSNKNATRASYDNYSTFYTFWNQEVQSDWEEYMHGADILSSREMASIDQKLNQWASVSKPESNLMTYLFGASVLALVVLGVILFREKANGGKTSEDKTSE